MDDQLSVTGEEYLLTIYHLEKEKKVARPKDICARQNVAKSTVTAALQCLAGKGLVHYQPYEPVTLTESGLAQAKQLCLRKAVIEDFLTTILLLPEENIGESAEAMIHNMPQQILRRFVCFMTLFKENMNADSVFLHKFRKLIMEHDQATDCRSCLEIYAKLNNL